MFICIFVFAFFSFVHFIWSSKSIFSINVFFIFYMCICVFVYLRKCVFHISSPLTRWRVGASSWESESLLMIYASRRKPTENWKQRKVCENTEENISVEALKKILKKTLMNTCQAGRWMLMFLKMHHHQPNETCKNTKIDQLNVACWPDFNFLTCVE